MTMERDSLVARLGKLHEYDLVLDTNAYPKGPMAEGRDVYRVIGWEGADRGGLLLSEVEAREVRAAFRESSAAAALSRPEQAMTDAKYFIEDGKPLQNIGAGDALAIIEDMPATPPEAWAAGWNACAALTTAAPLQAGICNECAGTGREQKPWMNGENCLVCGGTGSSPSASDTAPSPKGVSDGVRADAARYRWLRDSTGGRSNRWPHVTQYPHQPNIDRDKPPQIMRDGEYRGEYLDEAIDAAMQMPPERLLNEPARLRAAALSQEPVPATAEERAASKEGA